MRAPNGWKRVFVERERGQFQAVCGLETAKHPNSSLCAARRAGARALSVQEPEVEIDVLEDLSVIVRRRPARSPMWWGLLTTSAGIIAALGALAWWVQAGGAR